MTRARDRPAGQPGGPDDRGAVGDADLRAADQGGRAAGRGRRAAGGRRWAWRSSRRGRRAALPAPVRRPRPRSADRSAGPRPRRAHAPSLSWIDHDPGGRAATQLRARISLIGGHGGHG